MEFMDKETTRRLFPLALMFLAIAAMADPQARAVYEQAAALKGKRPFDLAVSDYFHGKNLLSDPSGGK
jgi:hypothetical protein